MAGYPCCCGPRGDDCGSLFGSSGSVPSALVADIPTALFTGGGAGHDGGDCTTEECQERTGLIPLEKVPWDTEYEDCFGSGAPYKPHDPHLEETSCLWVSEAFSVCDYWTLEDPDFGTPGAEQTIRFAWAAYADYDLFLGAYIYLILVRVCEGCTYWYYWKSAELTPGSITWPVEMFRDAGADGGVCLGIDSCVIDDDETLMLDLPA